MLELRVPTEVNRSCLRARRHSRAATSAPRISANAATRPRGHRIVAGIRWAGTFFSAVTTAGCPGGSIKFRHRMPATNWGWEISPEELASWVVLENDAVLVVNKPGLVVCHPSKHGPWSSLVGALRESGRLPKVHMVYRLDRETSGVMVFAKDSRTATRLQTAVEGRRVRKTYLAVVQGRWENPRVIDEPMGRDLFSGISSRQRVFRGPEAQDAVTEFEPLAHGDGVTLLRAHPHTGRMHQIRLHASWAGHAVVGDKLYGPDHTLFLEFIEHGFTERLAAVLPLRRQALHAFRMEFGDLGSDGVFSAPLPADLLEFCAARGITIPHTL